MSGCFVRKTRSLKTKNLSLVLFGVLFSRNALARLVTYRAAGFASGLTGASAFAASDGFSFSGNGNGFNSGHNNALRTNFFFIYYTLLFSKKQSFCRGKLHPFSYFLALRRVKALIEGKNPYVRRHSLSDKTT